MTVSAPAFALAAVGLWSTNALVAKYALADMTVAQTLALQFAGAVCVFAVFARRRGAMPLPWSARAIGVVGLVGTVALQYIAFATAPIATANLIAYSWPLLTAVLVVALGAACQPVRLIAASIAGFGGVALVIGGGPLVATPGILAAIASAACMASYSVAVSRTTDTPARLLLPSACIGFAGSAVWWIAAGHGGVAPIDAVAGLYLGLGPMGLGYVLWSRAMQGGSAGTLSTLGYATPVLSTVLLVVSGEHLSQTALIGAAVIVGACIVSQPTRSSEQHAPGISKPTPRRTPAKKNIRTHRHEPA